MMLYLVLLLVVSLEFHTALPITNLPNVNGKITFSQYSGYITVDAQSGRNLFYWFVESKKDPTTDPVVVWLQGGPGCSSLIGLFTENGPFVPNLDGGLDFNPLSWNNLANVLYIEAPVGVGFSYSHNLSDYNTNDDKTASDNLIFLENFFTEFPQFSKNDLYISGESYAGDYVPQLVQLILDNSPSMTAALKGFLIGNPVMSCPTWKELGNTIQIELFFWHGLIPYASYQKWMNGDCAKPNANPSAACLNLFNSINNVIGNYDPDNLYTDFCSGNATLDATSVRTPNCATVYDMRDSYLNRPDVQASIHANPTLWVSCTNSSSLLNFTTDWPDMIPVYEYIFSKAPNINVLIYSGDVDIATVPHAYTQICLADLDSPLVVSWRPWFVNGQTAGYVEVHDKYTYATVKGAGHEVPSYQPWSAYHMFTQYLSRSAL